MWKPFSHSLWRSCIPFCERKKKKDELKLNHREMYNVSNGRRPIPWSALCITSHRRTEKSRRLIHLHRGIQSCRDIFWCSGMGKKLRLVQCHEVQFKPESVCPHHHSVSWSILIRKRNWGWNTWDFWKPVTSLQISNVKRMKPSWAQNGFKKSTERSIL